MTVLLMCAITPIYRLDLFIFFTCTSTYVHTRCGYLFLAAVSNQKKYWYFSLTFVSHKFTAGRGWKAIKTQTDEMMHCKLEHKLNTTVVYWHLILSEEVYLIAALTIDFSWPERLFHFSHSLKLKHRRTLLHEGEAVRPYFAASYVTCKVCI